jgi:PTS system nitrogen regulatory IIA component
VKKSVAMLLTEFLDFDAIRIDMGAGNKRSVLNQLSQVAGQRLGIDPTKIADAIAERERLGSTGFGGGVAIPHGKLADVERIYGLVVRMAQPIDYKALDGEPVDLIFMLLSPPDAGAEHLKALAAISRLVRNTATVEKLRGARTRDALAAVLLGADERDAA